MQQFGLILLCFTLSLTACSKSSGTFSTPAKGVYSGSFQRMNQANSPIATVSIHFNFPNWSGNSNINKYPALGAGTFSYRDNAYFSFSNTTAWTDDFDHTLILQGNYIDQVKGDSLFITKSYGNGWVDVYKLKKQ